VAFAEFGKILPTAGLVNALSRAKQVSTEMADTVFWATLGLSCLVVLVTGLIARPIGGRRRRAGGRSAAYGIGDDPPGVGGRGDACRSR
jgi:hypothetical protein